MRKTLTLAASLAVLAGPATAASPDAYISANTTRQASIPYDPAAPYVKGGGPVSMATLPVVKTPSTAAVPQTDTTNPQTSRHDVRNTNR